MKFIDVPYRHWSFLDVDELTDLPCYLNERFIVSIPYNTFADDKMPLDLFTAAITNGQSEFVLDTVITPTNLNPLIVYINRVEAGYEKCEPNMPVAGKTWIKLRRGVSQGTEVRFFSAGEPAMQGDMFNQPAGGQIGHLPTCELPVSDPIEYMYYFDDTYGNYTERLEYQGKQLRRVKTTADIKFPEDYTVEMTYDPATAHLYTHYSMNNCALEMTFTEKVKVADWFRSRYVKIRPTSDLMLYTNRFFPDTKVKRQDFVILLEKLRLHFVTRYTDLTSGLFPTGIETDYRVSKFADMQTKLLTEIPYWWNFLYNYERLSLPDPTKTEPPYTKSLIPRRTGNNFEFDTVVSRGEMAEFLWLLREWLIENLK